MSMQNVNVNAICQCQCGVDANVVTSKRASYVTLRAVQRCWSCGLRGRARARAEASTLPSLQRSGLFQITQQHPGVYTVRAQSPMHEGGWMLGCVDSVYTLEIVAQLS